MRQATRHQHRHVQQSARRGIGRNGTRQRRKEQADQKQYANNHRRQTGTAARGNARCRLDVTGRGGSTQRSTGHGRRAIGHHGTTNARQLAILVQQLATVCHAHQRTRGIEQVHEQERKNHAQHGHVQRTHQIHGHERRRDGRRHGHDPAILVVAQHHGHDGHPQNTDHHRTGHAQVGQRGNHEKAQQGVNGRRLGQVAQRHIGRRVGHHDARILQGDHRQEQTDTRRNAQSQRQRNRINDPFANFKNTQQEKGQTREEDGP